MHLPGEADAGDAGTQIGGNRAHQRLGAGDDALGILLVASGCRGKIRRMRLAGRVQLPAGSIDHRDGDLASAAVDAEKCGVTHDYRSASLGSPLPGVLPWHGRLARGPHRSLTGETPVPRKDTADLHVT